MNRSTIKKHLTLAVPVLYLAWSLQLNLWGGPFFLSRSDPEYPYLLNGLNCATLQFNHIGHTDHPGTPFQLLTGAFIRVTHFLIGQKPLVEDVLSRPETYLAMSSLLLSLLTFALLWWIGRLAWKKTGGLTGTLMLQSTFILANVLVDIPLRYNPDRMLVIYVLILAGLTIKYLHDETYSSKRYAILTGILMGIGFATKFNFLPILVVPLFIIPEFRNRFYYGLSLAGAFVASILPILNKFRDFKRFITGVASHDGLYGQGPEQMINWKSFIHNFFELLYRNPAFTVILLASAGTVAWWFVRRKSWKGDLRNVQFLQGFLLAALLGFILVSKHFKIYYFAPVLAMSGLILFTIHRIAGERGWGQRMIGYGSPVVLAILILLSVAPVPRQNKGRIEQKKANRLTEAFYDTQVNTTDWKFVEPTWMAGPYVENALVYGVSYVAGRQDFYRDYEKPYPNVLTWEGQDKNPRLFRMVETDPEALLFGGRDFYVYSSPGRDAGKLMDQLDTLATRFGTHLTRDTAFTNPVNHDRVIRVRNTDGWKMLWSHELLVDEHEMNPASPVSESAYFGGVRAGDYLEATVEIRNNDTEPEGRCRLIVRSEQSQQDGIYYEDSGSLQDIGHGWQLLRLRARVQTGPADGKLVGQVYYPGKKSIRVQHFKISHMGIR